MSTQDTELRVNSWHTGRRLLAYLRPYLWPYFAAAMVCMTIYSATSGAVPYLVRSLVDDVLQAGNQRMVALMPLLILVVFVIRAAVNFGQAYLGEYVGQKIVFDIRQELNDRIQHLPLSYLDRTASGSVLSRVTTDVLLVRQALTEGAAAMIRDTTTVVVLVGVSFYIDSTLALVSFIVFPAVVLPLQGLSRKMKNLSHRGLDTLGRLTALLQETILGNRVVKAFGMEDYEKKRFEAENLRLFGLHMKAARIKAFTAPMMEVLAALGIAGVLWIGGASVVAGGRTPGSFIAFLTALVLIYDPFKKIVRTNNLVQAGLGAAERIFELVDCEPEAHQRTGDRSLTGLQQGIRFENVRFAYGQENVLHGVSFDIGAGDVVALVGPSGGGKSTLADLIPRFYEVGTGRITIDGTDICDFDLSSLRSQISVVTQFTFLFNDSVRNNIAYGRIETTEDAIVEAARAANADEFIRQLPEGYDTVVGELGVQLSGGQRQRIAIARALLKDSPILILDEATSALDAASERLVQEAIERAMENRTTLVIAHRLSTVDRADKIVVVSEGRIVESGTHAELIEQGQLYQRLYAMQFRDFPDSGGEHFD
ncbi:MAG: ABC transporter transmembrane domain-containing protein [Deltaproteobacteria bacterium]